MNEFRSYFETTRAKYNGMECTRAVTIHSCHDPIRFDSVKSRSDRFDPIHYPFVQTNTTKIYNSECSLNDLLNKLMNGHNKEEQRA